MQALVRPACVAMAKRHPVGLALMVQVRDVMLNNLLHEYQKPAYSSEWRAIL